MAPDDDVENEEQLAEVIMKNNPAITVIPIPGVPANQVFTLPKGKRGKAPKPVRDGKKTKDTSRADFLKVRNTFSPLSQENDQDGSDDDDQDGSDDEEEIEARSGFFRKSPLDSAKEATEDGLAAAPHEKNSKRQNSSPELRDQPRPKRFSTSSPSK